MKESEPSSKSTEKELLKVIPKVCPICKTPSVLAYGMHDPKKKQDSLWYHCQCGVAFQSEYPSHDVYDKVYTAEYIGFKEAKLRGEYAARLYAPLIEELIYSRNMLDVGFNTPYVMDYMEDRGWNVWGIDINKDTDAGGNKYKGDFLTYDFQPKPRDKAMKELVEKGKIKRTFDLIFMSHVLEHFNDPLAALRKCWNLIPDGGVLFIAVPDVDFIFKLSPAGFPHWTKKEHYVLWNERALRREVERIGFKVIMSRRNFSSRFISWYDVHLLAQRPYF